MRSDSDSRHVGHPRPAETESLDLPPPPATFGQRHGLKVMAAVMVTMFITVIVAQVGC